MATFMSIPLELRLEVYRELFSSNPRASRIGQNARGTVALYSDRTFYTAILGVNKKVHEEAVSVLYGETVWKLHVYLIFRGDKYHGSNLGDALHALTRSNHFHYIRTCSLDVRVLRDQSKKDTTFHGTEMLRANVRLVSRFLSRACRLQEVEVSWRHYLDHDYNESVRKSFKPLEQLTTKSKLPIKTVGNDIDGSMDSACWPDMLKAYRVMLFARACGSGKETIEWRARENHRTPFSLKRVEGR